MGYRSDVAYVIAFKDVAERDTFVGLVMHKDDDPLLKQALAETKHDYKQEALITFQEQDTKWYPDYPEVRAHVRLMNWAEEVCEAQYRLVRVGEEVGDVEVDETRDSSEFELWDYIDPVQTLRIDFPAE